MSPHPVRKFAIADASFERSPGQNGDVFAANFDRRAARWADYRWLRPLRAGPEH